MGERKYQRVVLIAGLLFLTIIIMGFIFNYILQRIQLEKYGVIGQLITNHPEMELELIETFEVSKQRDMDIQAGRELEEKYGYMDVRTNSIQYIRIFMLYSILILVTSTLLIVIILIYFEYKQNKHELEQERTKEHLKELEERNQVLLEKLTLEEKATKALITDISHQLKTPLASLKMSYEIAQMDNFTEDERKVFLIKGWEEIKKLASLLESLLNLTRLESNMIQIRPVPFSLTKTLIGAVNSVYMKAYDKRIEIVMDEFEDTNIMHDPKWTQEAIVNILDNAIKYSNSDTRVKIRVSFMVTCVVIEIEDQGIGIHNKDYPNIFKRFYRGNNERVLHTEGSGVGLYLVRKVLEEQGGSICAKPGNTNGSSFQLTLPKV